MDDAVRGQGCVGRLRSFNKTKKKNRNCSDDMRNGDDEEKKKYSHHDMKKNLRNDANEEKRKSSDDMRDGDFEEKKKCSRHDMKKNLRNDANGERRKSSDDMRDGDDEEKKCSRQDMKKNLRNDADEEKRKSSDDMRDGDDEEKKKRSRHDMKKNSRNDADEEKRKRKRKRKRKCSDDLKKSVLNDASKEATSHSDWRKNRKAGSDAEQRGKKLLNGDKKAKSRKVTTPFFEKMRKIKMQRTSNQNGEKNMKSDGDSYKKTVPLSVNKGKMEKDGTNKRTLSNTLVAKERKMRPSDSMEMKMKKKKRDASFVQPDERTAQTFSTKNKEKKRKAPSTPLKREQKERVASSDNKKETKKACIVAIGNEKKNCRDGKKKKRKAAFAFFKFVRDEFEELLFIPPAVAPSLKDLIDRHVYLEDSEGKCSKIRLSVVDGSLAFYEGWNSFVSEHCIKWGEFLLFEYTPESTFSVRVFGIDSCERLHFSVKSGGKGAVKKRKERHTLSDDLISHYNGQYQDSEDIHDDPNVSGESPRSKEPKIAVDAEIGTRNLVAKSINAASETQDSERVESGIGYGSLGALGNKVRNLSNGECDTRSDSVFCIQEKTRRSEVIIISDEAYSTQVDEDTMKQTAPSEASEIHHVTINTQKDLERVVDGVCCESSVALNNKMGNLILGEPKNKNISPACSTEKTNGSEITPTTGAIPLTQENIDTVKLNTLSCFEEDRSTTRESELAAAIPTISETHDSDKDLGQKHQRNSVQVNSIIAVDKYLNDSEMNISGNIFRIYEAPAGTRCLEKWKRGIVNGRAALDDIGQVRPEKTQKAGEKLVGNCGAMGESPVDLRIESDVTDTCLKPILNIPIEELSILDSVSISKCGRSRTEVNHLFNQKGATVQLQTKKEPLKPTGSSGNRKGDKIAVSVNRVFAHQSELQIPQQENGNFTSCVTPVALLPAKAELLDLDDHSLQFCIPSTIQKWLELPKSLPITCRQKGRYDRNVVILKDPMRRLWPVFYHDKPVFVGFTAGWKPFAAANNLQAGDVCKFVKEMDEDELAFQVYITRK
ncbi:B3 domain-containing protein Os02g0598200 [Oryza glaberrima]|uniref:TF-B3 domain-containing protein n=1 Tax=Oryza glaberrima TaxID=4538 RepID=I1P1V3_ORYGL|nr:B3 domain-containing protein Os02g0598200 [Oryza glaberrima]XP_052141668.1 B3 domain-containing protein Os02g0598200 [Oryza glaberrima]